MYARIHAALAVSIPATNRFYQSIREVAPLKSYRRLYCPAVYDLTMHYHCGVDRFLCMKIPATKNTIRFYCATHPTGFRYSDITGTFGNISPLSPKGAQLNKMRFDQ